MRLKAKMFMLAAVLVMAATLLSGCSGWKATENLRLKEIAVSGLQELWKKFTGEEEDNAKIVINTVFGEKTFRIKDIKGIKLVLENGETRDFSGIIKL